MTTAVSTGGGNPAEVIDHVNGFIDKIFSPDTIGPTGSRRQRWQRSSDGVK